ncbi:MAG: hypothetical protein M9894_00085 [Planctomycetes bacterium]|nr:hypothetical protein [Planctomycetota bacterium]
MTATTPPTIDALVQQGWADHERDPEGVLARVREALPRVDAPAPLPALAALVVHVAGEHLGRWAEGLALLDALAARAHDPAGAEAQALRRSRAALLLCQGDRAGADAALEGAQPADLSPASARVRALAVAASALAGQRRTAEARALFEEALALAGDAPTAADPATRALAVTGNNLACALEERPDRAPEDDRLLELAATTARRCWEVAGGWVEVERAEYRLAMTKLALGRAQEAVTHAAACLAGCEANGAGPDELLFAHEVVARARRAAGDEAGAAAARARVAALVEQVDPDLRELARETLAKLG